MLRSVDFHVSHIFHEGNNVVDELSKFAILASPDQQWFCLPSFCLVSHHNDVSEVGFYRFCN